MYKNVLYSVGIFVISFLLFYTIFKVDTSRVTNKISMNSVEDISVFLDETYDKDEKVLLKNMYNVYMPVYEEINMKDVKSYANSFGCNINMVETEEYYKFQNGDTELFVYKILDKVIFKDNGYKKNGYIMAPDEAVSVAKKFFSDRGIDVKSEVVEFEEFDGCYRISFINKVLDILDYGFPQAVVMDRYGHVLEAEYNYTKFIKIDAIKPIARGIATSRLPEGVKNISGGDIVYNFENSILQPMYLFFYTENGDSKNYFVSGME